MIMLRQGDSVLTAGLWRRLPLLAAGPAKLGWRHTLPAFERLGKILGIVETALFRDLLHAHCGIEQEIFRHPAPLFIQQVLVAGILFPELSPQSP